MQTKSDRLDIIKKMIYQEKAILFSVIVSTVTCSSITLRRDLKTLQTLTSYTHRGSYVTLPDIPKFNNFGIWFYKGIGFSKFKNSLELIIRIIEASKEGITKAEIESLLRIGISKQIQILLEQERLHRIKIGAQYVYIPNKVITDKKMRLKIVGSRQIEEHYGQEVTISDLIAVLKVVLQEGRIEMRLLKRWINKYSLKIPVAKLEHIITKYELDEKKMPLASFFGWIYHNRGALLLAAANIRRCICSDRISLRSSVGRDAVSVREIILPDIREVFWLHTGAFSPFSISSFANAS